MDETSGSADPRYARHLLVPQIGAAGQDALARSRVLVVGAGGLGSPVLLYLAAAGVGAIGIVDDDVVELTNLQRQVVHDERGLGTLKTDSARARLEALNSTTRVETFPVRMTPANAVELATGYHVVVDCTDSFAARYVVDDVCVELDVPHVWASVLDLGGQASVFWASHGPCYRCVFPVAPEPGTIPAGPGSGILGVLPGILGAIQAAETLKVLMGVGEPLIGRLLVHDAVAATYHVLPAGRDPRCPRHG